MTRTMIYLLLVTCLGVAGCATPNNQGRQNELLSTLVGAAIGGYGGSRIGSGDGQLATTAAGTFIGAVIGNNIGRGLDERDRLRAAQVQPTRVVYGQPQYRQPIYRAPNSVQSACSDNFYGSTTKIWRSPNYPRLGRLYDSSRRHGGNRTGAILGVLAESFSPRTTRRSRESTRCSSESYGWVSQPGREKY